MILDLSSSRDLLLALLPELVLTAWSLVLLLLIAWRHRTAADLRLAGCVTLAALASTAGAVWWLWWHAARAAPTPLAAMIAVDDFRFVTDWLFLGAAALTVLLSFDYGPSTAPENDPMATAILRHCFKKDLQVVSIALYPLGGDSVDDVIRGVGEEAPEVLAH